MKWLASPAELAAWRAEVASSDSDVGLVPTMGALHEGHLSLVRRSAEENASTLVSLFVNPAQFDDPADLESYPRDTARDTRLLEEAGCDAVFAPTASQIYPQGFQTWVEVERVSSPLEGAARPGHFRGVATVVLKLLLLSSPRRAYFGQKDAQQLAVVRRMVQDLELPVRIVACATIRESDGLAMSSRNRRLAPAHRTAASALFEALDRARRAWDSGVRSGAALRELLRAWIEREPAARIDYVSVADPQTFEEVDDLDPASPPLLSLAVRFGTVRLIDNLPLERPPLHSTPKEPSC